MPPIISITGRANSGKSRLISALIKEFKKRNIKISVIKHTSHDFQFPDDGKDSSQFKKAGATLVAISNDFKYAIDSIIEKALSPEEIAKKYMWDISDIILIEGYKKSALPKIEVIGDSKEPPLFKTGIKNIQAIITDIIIDTDLPVYRRDDIKKIADYICNFFTG